MIAHCAISKKEQIRQRLTLNENKRTEENKHKREQPTEASRVLAIINLSSS